MSKENKMPTTKVLLAFSCLIAVLGLAISSYLLFAKPFGVISLVNSASVLLGSLLLAVIVRVIANIGQMIFDLKTLLFELKLQQEQINCDSKDINQNIHQIKTFFEQIERHLDFKK